MGEAAASALPTWLAHGNSRLPHAPGARLERSLELGDALPRPVGAAMDVFPNLAVRSCGNPRPRSQVERRHEIRSAYSNRLRQLTLPIGGCDSVRHLIGGPSWLRFGRAHRRLNLGSRYPKHRHDHRKKYASHKHQPGIGTVSTKPADEDNDKEKASDSGDRK